MTQCAVATDEADFRMVMARFAADVIVVGNLAEMGGQGGEPLLFYGGRNRKLDRESGASYALGLGPYARTGQIAP